MKRTFLLIAILTLPLSLRAQDSLDKLATDFWTWRAQWQPFNSDDIPRIERPAGLKPSWSADSIAHQRTDLAAFEARWKKARPHQMARPAASGLSSDRLRARPRALGTRHQSRWQNDPTFYVDQAMTPVVEAILPPPPFDKTRSSDLIARVQNIPSIVEDAEANLQHPCAPFAKLAIASLCRHSLAVVADRPRCRPATERRQRAGTLACGRARRLFSRVLPRVAATASSDHAAAHAQSAAMPTSFS